MFMRYTKYPILLTGLASLVLTSISLYLFYHSFEKIKIEDTSDIRNIALILLAIAGIPFLILGHITKRADLNEKRNDLAIKTDTILFNSLLKTTKESRDELNGIFQDIDELYNIPDKNDLSSVKPFHNERYILHDFITDLEPVSNPRDVSELKKRILNWHGFTSVSLSVLNTMKAAKKIKSHTIRNLVYSGLITNIGEYNLKILYLITMADEAASNPKYGVLLNSSLFYLNLTTSDFSRTLSDGFIRDIEDLRRRYDPQGAS